MSLPIRNFCIIAHINHGKSTLADRLLELTRTITPEKMHSQYLDSHPIERERGITIKLAPVRMTYTLSPKTYTLNLIDTPGHVDFSYEVSRSLAACEGAVLIADALAGIQAQTIANLTLAREQGLKIIPVINKIDLEGAVPEKVAQDLVDSLGFLKEEILFVSAKTGQNVEAVLKAVVKRIPPPSSEKKSFRGLVFNSVYDSHKGVILWLRVKDGQISSNLKIKLLATGATGTVSEVGYFSPQMTPSQAIGAGEVGYLTAGIKDLSLCQAGDTIVLAQEPAPTPLKGYQPISPLVFASLYPLDNQDFLSLKSGLEKLALTDASLSFSPEFSVGLGKGFRCGFLGLLHAEVVQERLSRDFGVDLVMTNPIVEYQVQKKDGQKVRVSKPSELPDPSQIETVLEPQAELKIFSPFQYLGELISLVKARRGALISQDYFGHQIKLTFRLPLAEMIVDLYDQVKSVSSGFASFDWRLSGFIPVEAVRLDILFNHRPVEAFSRIIPRSKAASEGRRLVEKLVSLIPRQQFEVALQAAIGKKIIARETIRALRKDVTAKLYGGDQTRKDKLLKKQKKGKKKLKMIGHVSVPQEVFLKVLRN
jgi:GTP-binding protein LepA